MIREKRAENRRNYAPIDAATAPTVSIIVPGYNEEVNIVRTITTLKQQDYPNLHIYFVDDGSKDHTLERVHEAFDNDDTVTVLAKKNGGKASALNYGNFIPTVFDFIIVAFCVFMLVRGIQALKRKDKEEEAAWMKLP